MNFRDPHHPKIWLAHDRHENDEVYSENLLEYFEEADIRCEIMELTLSGPQPELQQCIDDKPTAVFGFNSQLDHSWLESSSFICAAAEHGVAVVQWILDHPSLRWPEFINSTSRNSAFLFNSAYTEQYFQQYCLQSALTATMGQVGPNKRSRVTDLSLDSFLERPILCLIPLLLSRLAGTRDAMRTSIDALGSPLAAAVQEAITTAFSDLSQPLEWHLSAVLETRGQTIDHSTFNRCFSLVDESVQLHRRLKILDVAKDYPLFIQSDRSVHSLLPQKTKATVVAGVGMRSTLERTPLCRAVLSVSNLSDMIHDRTMNGLNAGCVIIVEDSIGHGGILEHGKNALLFRYGDDSLHECLDIVCNQPHRAYEIASAGLALRDNPRFRFGEFHNILEIARKQSARLR